MNRLRISLCLLLLAAVSFGGCGQGQKGKAQVWVSRDRGRAMLESGTVPAGLTALQGLDRLARVETGYGGAFVNGIDGVSSSQLHQRDWFFYVNGYEADRGAASYRLRAGDVEWWDYRSWRGSERVPVVVGAFPELAVEDGELTIDAAGRLAFAAQELRALDDNDHGYRRTQR